MQKTFYRCLTTYGMKQNVLVICPEINFFDLPKVHLALLFQGLMQKPKIILCRALKIIQILILPLFKTLDISSKNTFHGGQNNNNNLRELLRTWVMALVVYGQLQEVPFSFVGASQNNGHKSRIMVIIWPQSLVQLFKQNSKVFHYKYQEQLRCLIDQKVFEVRNTRTTPLRESLPEFSIVFFMSGASCRKKDYLVKHASVKVLLLETG